MTHNAAPPPRRRGASAPVEPVAEPLPAPVVADIPDPVVHAQPSRPVGGYTDLTGGAGDSTPLTATPTPVAAPMLDEPVEVPQVEVPQVVVPVRTLTSMRDKAAQVDEPEFLAAAETPTAVVPPTGGRRLNGLSSGPRLPMLATEPLTARRRKRRLVIGGVCTIVVLLAGHTAYTVLQGSPSAADVAAVVSQSIPADGYYSSEITVGEQFLRAYLNSANTPEAREARARVLDALTNGQGSDWVVTPGEKSEDVTQTVLDGPALIQPPRPSETVPGADTLVYSAWVTDTTGVSQQMVFSVLVARDEHGFATVIAPPSLLPQVPAIAPDLPAAPNEEGTADAVSPNLEQFLKVWAQAGPNADKDTLTQLNAFLAPDATFYTSTGLSGTVAYVNLSNLKLARTAENSPVATGTVNVTWQRPTGETYTQAYSLEVENVNDKWLVRRIGSL